MFPPSLAYGVRVFTLVVEPFFYKNKSLAADCPFIRSFQQLIEFF